MKVRVYRLAELMGVEATSVLAAIGEVDPTARVTSVGCEVSSEVEARVREHFKKLADDRVAADAQRRGDELRELKRRAEEDRRSQQHDQGIVKAATGAGLPRPGTVRGFSAPRRRGGRVGRPPVTDAEREAQRFVESSLGVPALFRESPWKTGRGGSFHEIDSWDRAFIDPVAKKQWMAAGLGPEDAQLALELSDLGLRPHHLRMIIAIDGTTACDAIRRGRSLKAVVTRIQEIESA